VNALGILLFGEALPLFSAKSFTVVPVVLGRLPGDLNFLTERHHVISTLSTMCPLSLKRAFLHCRWALQRAAENSRLCMSCGPEGAGHTLNQDPTPTDKYRGICMYGPEAVPGT
jgi:hypothetical protein